MFIKGTLFNVEVRNDLLDAGYGGIQNPLPIPRRESFNVRIVSQKPLKSADILIGPDSALRAGVNVKIYGKQVNLTEQGYTYHILMWQAWALGEPQLVSLRAVADGETVPIQFYVAKAAEYEESIVGDAVRTVQVRFYGSGGGAGYITPGQFARAQEAGAVAVTHTRYNFLFVEFDGLQSAFERRFPLDAQVQEFEAREEIGGKLAALKTAIVDLEKALN